MAFWLPAAHSPVSRAEIAYQRHMARHRNLNQLFVPALALVLALFAVQEGGWLAGRFVLMVEITIQAGHVLACSAVLLLAFEAIMREKRGRTWDMLRLTRVPGGACIRGKWYATLHAVLPIYARLIALKVLFMVWQLWQIAEKTPAPAWPGRPFDDAILVVAGVLGLAFISVYLLLDAMYTAGLGLLAALITPARWRRVGVGVAVFVRLFPPLATLTSLIYFQITGYDLIPTEYNTHISIAARYIEQWHLESVGSYGPVNEVFSALVVTVPDGPFLAFFHATSGWHVVRFGTYAGIVVRSLLIALVAAGGLLLITAQVAARQWAALIIRKE